MTIEVQDLIQGEWTGRPEIERRNPADPTDLVSVTVGSTPDSVDRAVSSAREAHPGWAATPMPARGAILLRAGELMAARRDEIARDLTREEGKTLAEATGEVSRTVDMLKLYGSLGWAASGSGMPSATPETAAYTMREPLGVVGLITPWNFPLSIPTWKLAPALVAGNAAVLRPAEITSVSVHHLARVLMDAGLPAGVLNVVHGEGSVAGRALTEHHDVDAISFTGSTAVGEQVRAATEARGARVQLEMGGKNAVLVADDADIAEAARIIALGGFGLTGQACTATSRVVCSSRIADALVQRLADLALEYRPGNGLEKGTKMGPVSNEAQLDINVTGTKRACDEGELVCGGKHDGLLFEPTLLTGLAPDSLTAQEEIFGPVIGVIVADTVEEQIAVVNNSRYGLTAGLCTNNLRLAQRFIREARVGLVKVNRPTTGLDPSMPFGGIKGSSSNTFREQGAQALDFFTWTKAVYVGW